MIIKSQICVYLIDGSVTMGKLKNLFFIMSLLGIIILIGIGVYFYQIQQNFKKFESNFQQMIMQFDQQAIHSENLIHLKINNDTYLKGEYEKIELLMIHYLKRSLEVENRYRQQKNNIKVNTLFEINQLKNDRSLAEAESILNQADLLMIKMYQEKSDMFDQLIIDANQIELSTDKKTDQFHQNFDKFFAQYVKSQEQILALEKQNLASKREMLNLLKTKEWTIENDQLVFTDPNNLQQYQYLQNEIKRIHLEKVSMQGKTLRLFLTIY